MEEVDAFAELRSDAIDGRDVKDLVDVHGQAAAPAQLYPSGASSTAAIHRADAPDTRRCARGRRRARPADRRRSSSLFMPPAELCRTGPVQHVVVALASAIAQTVPSVPFGIGGLQTAERVVADGPSQVAQFGGQRLSPSLRADRLLKTPILEKCPMRSRRTSWVIHSRSRRRRRLRLLRGASSWMPDSCACWTMPRPR